MLATLIAIIIAEISTSSDIESDLHFLNISMMTVGLVLGACVLILWISGLKWVISTQNQRSQEKNVLLYALLFIGPVFAGYVIYFIRKQ